MTEPGDQAAAEHPVELGDLRGPAGRAARVDVGERHRARERLGGRALDRGGGAAAASSVPHSPQSGQRPSHFGDS